MVGAPLAGVAGFCAADDAGADAGVAAGRFGLAGAGGGTAGPPRAAGLEAGGDSDPAEPGTAGLTGRGGLAGRGALAGTGPPLTGAAGLAGAAGGPLGAEAELTGCIFGAAGGEAGAAVGEGAAAGRNGAVAEIS